MMTSMYVGATLYPVREFRRREVLELVTRERVTYFGAVPYMFVILADTPVRGTVDLSSLRTVFSASAPLLPADNRRFREKSGHWIRQLYGSTETGTISVNLAADVESTLASVGCPLPDTRFDVVDEHGHAMPAGEDGEVRIASPGVIPGYDGNPEANASAFRDGWYWSGDLGRLSADGALTLTGRKKFLINRGGFKINPLEVEEAIASHPKVAEVVVAGAPGPHGDDVVRCVIVGREPCTVDEIVAHCATRIADYKIPSRIEFRDALPKSETGKLLASRLYALKEYIWNAEESERGRAREQPRRLTWHVIVLGVPRELRRLRASDAAAARARRPIVDDGADAAIAYRHGWGIVDRLVADGVPRARAAAPSPTRAFPRSTVSFQLAPQSRRALPRAPESGERPRREHVPRPLRAAFDAAETREGVPASLVAAIVHVESSAPGDREANGPASPRPASRWRTSPRTSPTTSAATPASPPTH
jgi:hypothetical protein